MLFPNENFFNVHDGVLGAIAIDDEKPMAIWSHYHADALAARMREFRERLRVAEWTVGDTRARLAANAQATAVVRDRLQACVDRAEAERDAIRARLAELTQRARVMEAARQADWYAIKVSPFEFED
ncbi:MAG: hypothetical protein MUD17_06050 [Gemmatimonadaceae bacterium]|jgi:uncharacterized protein (DUF3084 family)|nr:hypothetical protein [Gemmatimonadaceae bacterium]